MSQIGLTEAISVGVAGSVAMLAAFLKALPVIKRMFGKQKISYVSLSKPELIMLLKETSSMAEKRIGLRTKTRNKQQLDARTCTQKVSAELELKINSFVDDNGLDVNLKVEFLNAMECVMAELRESFYSILDANHLLERDNWDQFVNEQIAYFMNLGINKLQDRFPKYTEYSGWGDYLKGMDKLIRDSTAYVFGQARKYASDLEDSLAALDKEYETIVDKLYA